MGLSVDRYWLYPEFAFRCWIMIGHVQNLRLADLIRTDGCSKRGAGHPIGLHQNLRCQLKLTPIGPFHNLRSAWCSVRDRARRVDVVTRGSIKPAGIGGSSVEMMTPRYI
jgi:hypothetical protein